MDEDSSLVRKTVDGDPTAFGALYDRYAPFVRALAFDVTRDMNAAQDLTQEVFLRAFVKLPTLRDRRRFGPWLVSMARHMFQEWRRSRRRDRHHFLPEPPEPKVTTDGLSDEALTELRLAISQLPERERVALHLHYLEEEPTSLGQQVLGLSYSAFYKIVARARDRLARILSNEQEIMP